MKPLVVFYTRFGHNITIAETVARVLGAPLRRIQIPNQPPFLVMGAYSSMNLRMKIMPMDLDVSAFDTVVLCTPIWAWKPAPPAREFLRLANIEGKRLAVCFSTTGGPTQRAQEKICQLLKGRDAHVFAFGEIPTQAQDPEFLKSEARAFAERIRQ